MIRWKLSLGSECCRRQVLLLGGGLIGAVRGHVGAGECFEAQVAAAFCHVVMLLGQDGADEPDAAGGRQSWSRAMRTLHTMFGDAC